MKFAHGHILFSTLLIVLVCFRVNDDILSCNPALIMTTKVGAILAGLVVCKAVVYP